MIFREQTNKCATCLSDSLCSTQTLPLSGLLVTEPWRRIALEQVSNVTESEKSQKGTRREEYDETRMQLSQMKSSYVINLVSGSPQPQDILESSAVRSNHMFHPSDKTFKESMLWSLVIKCSFLHRSVPDLK